MNRVQSSGLLISRSIASQYATSKSTSKLYWTLYPNWISKMGGLWPPVLGYSWTIIASKFISNVTWSLHSSTTPHWFDNCLQLLWQVHKIQASLCIPEVSLLLTSSAIPKLTWLWPLSAWFISLYLGCLMHVYTFLFNAWMCICTVLCQPPPLDTLNSLDHHLQVHLSVSLIHIGRCFSE